MDSGRRVHPDCINASNPYHECVEYCFKKIAEAKAILEKQNTGLAEAVGGRGGNPNAKVHEQARESLDDKRLEEESSEEEEEEEDNQEPEVDVTQLTGRKKKLFELRVKMHAARKSNQTDVGTEKKKMEAPTETKGISKQKWLEEKKKKIGKLLDANGLDMTKAYMLDTQETAETKYKKWEKEPTPAGWDVFNQKTLYNAYKKRTKNIQVDLEEYNRMRAADPEFYREASSLQYGKAPKTSQDKIDKMAKELLDREQKRQDFSRRRKFRAETSISTRKLSARLGNTHWRSKTTWNEELHYPTKLLELVCWKQGNGFLVRKVNFYAFVCLYSP